MSVALKIQLTPQAEKIVTAYGTLPARLVEAVKHGMDQANELALANIKAAHLTGKGPFPPSEHKLGRVTGLLRGSANATLATADSAGRVTSAIGSNVVYAAIHEFGGTIHREARQITVRHRLEKSGELAKQKTNVNLLVFAAKGAEHVRETKAEAKAHDVTMPERAPFRTGIAETTPKYNALISAAIVKEWKKMI